MMQNDLDEKLSAMADGELGAEETRFLIRRLANDPEARAQLSRYHAISAAARQEYVPGADSLGSRVAEALAAEPVHEYASRRWQRWLQPVAGGAIAATVALALVLAWPMFSDTPQRSAPIAQSDTLTPPLASTTAVGRDERLQLASQPNDMRDAQIRQRLNPYLVNHSEHASGGQLGGTLKYARIVSHDADR